MLLVPNQDPIFLPDAPPNAVFLDPNAPEEPTTRLDGMAGFVIESSTLESVRFHVLPTQDDVSEGSVVTIGVRGSEVLYQVIGAATRYESLDDQSALGYTEVIGRKLGTWDTHESCFKITSWLPDMFDPVRIWNSTTGAFEFESIGIIPRTNFHLSADPGLLVTHNTAILGVLGSGKTFLAFELIARIRRRPRLVQDLLAHRAGKCRPEPVIIHRRDRGEQVVGELAPDHRRELRDPFRAAERVDARHE